MAGNPENVDFWTGADVFFDFTRTAPLPADLVTAWDALWLPAGLLNGDDGMTETRDENSEDTFAWGSILVRTVYSQHKRTMSVVMLEDNATTFGLINPGDSTRTAENGVITSEIYVPRRKKIRMGLELRDGDKVKRRVVPTVELGEVSEVETNETTPDQYSATITLLPDGNGKLYTDLKTDVSYVAS
ncbi:hypothetical protein [Streptomonospora salina]|uniref:phage tail tube protein n=1 Tax=Streptomonospora salina TaxID=104205 RepID=UPI0031ECA42E